MKYSMLLLLFGAGVFLTAPSFAQDPADIGKGARIWADNCARCHNARSPMERTDRAWTTIVSHMRARANLTRTEARLVATYLKAMNAPEGMAAAGAGNVDHMVAATPLTDALPIEPTATRKERLTRDNVDRLLAFLQAGSE